MVHGLLVTDASFVLVVIVIAESCELSLKRRKTLRLRSLSSLLTQAANELRYHLYEWLRAVKQAAAYAIRGLCKT